MSALGFVMLAYFAALIALACLAVGRPDAAPWFFAVAMVGLAASVVEAQQ